MRCFQAGHHKLQRKLGADGIAVAYVHAQHSPTNHSAEMVKLPLDCMTPATAELPDDSKLSHFCKLSDVRYPVLVVQAIVKRVLAVVVQLAVSLGAVGPQLAMAACLS